MAVATMVAPIKKVDRSATICFDPAGRYLACGSVAGAIDLSFSTSSTLEVRPCGVGTVAQVRNTCLGSLSG